MSERTLHPIEYLLIFKRQRRWFIVPAVVCSVLAVALALLLPATYKTSFERQPLAKKTGR